MIACRPTSWKAMFCAEWRAARGDRDGANRCGYDTANCSACIAAHRSADHAEQLLDAEVVDQHALGADHVAIVITGKSRPHGSPVSGLISAGPVEPMQPPSTLAQITK